MQGLDPGSGGFESQLCHRLALGTSASALNFPRLTLFLWKAGSPFPPQPRPVRRTQRSLGQWRFLPHFTWRSKGASALVLLPMFGRFFLCLFWAKGTWAYVFPKTSSPLLTLVRTGQVTQGAGNIPP